MNNILAICKGFIQADYKDTHNGKRLIFESNSKSQWAFIKFIN